MRPSVLQLARRVFPVALLILAMSLTNRGISLADDRPSSAENHTADPKIRDAKIATLILQLGDDTCSRRETAMEELGKLGIATKVALTAAADHPDLEVRIRARQLLTTVLANDFQRRLQEFADDTTETQATDLPAWSKFKKQYGGGKSARKLFVEMQKADADLLATIADRPSKVSELLELRCQTFMTAQLTTVYRAGRTVMSTGAATAILFATTDEQVKINDSTGTWIAGLSQQGRSTLGPAIVAGEYDGLPKKLVAQWISRPVDKNFANTPRMNLTLAVTYQLPEGVVPARVVVQQPTAGFYKQQAFMVLAKHGGQEDLPAMEASFKEETTVGHLAVPNKVGPTAIQVRDVALCASLRLTGQNPKDYGYDVLVENETLLYNLNTIGFSDADARDAAFKKWQDWSAAHKK